MLRTQRAPIPQQKAAPSKWLHPQHRTQRFLRKQKPFLPMRDGIWRSQIFDDYVMPNEVVESGEFDANYFQHIPYLESFNEEKGTHLVNAGGIHYEPFGIYPGTKSDLSTSWLTATPSQCRTIPQTRREHFFCYRITASLH